MWNRKELKTSAKASLKANYWRSVFAACLAIISAGGAASTASNTAKDENVQASFDSLVNSYGAELVGKVILAVLGAVLVTALISTLVKIFLWNPVTVGCDKFFVNSREQGGESFKTVGWPFKNNYMRIVGTVFLRNLFITLWSLLLVVPGIVKAYEYRMVTYILADQPELSRKEAFALSKKMMSGNKWKTFVLDLSFFPWGILATVTLGIAGFFYVTPYVQHTYAALYLKLKAEQ